MKKKNTRSIENPETEWLRQRLLQSHAISGLSIAEWLRQAGFDLDRTSGSPMVEVQMNNLLSGRRKNILFYTGVRFAKAFGIDLGEMP